MPGTKVEIPILVKPVDSFVEANMTGQPLHGIQAADSWISPYYLKPELDTNDLFHLYTVVPDPTSEADFYNIIRKFNFNPPDELRQQKQVLPSEFQQETIRRGPEVTWSLSDSDMNLRALVAMGLVSHEERYGLRLVGPRLYIFQSDEKTGRLLAEKFGNFVNSSEIFSAKLLQNTREMEAHINTLPGSPIFFQVIDELSQKLGVVDLETIQETLSIREGLQFKSKLIKAVARRKGVSPQDVINDVVEHISSGKEQE